MIKDEAYKYLKLRGVTRLCHFTNFRNLLHIFPHKGIIAKAFLDSEKVVNDLLRLDNELEYICCSIEYPNIHYFLKIEKKAPPFLEWAILFIDMNVLKYNKSKFCPCNAATEHGRHISDDIGTLKAIYSQELNIKYKRKRTPKMLTCCATDDQAEILIHKEIPVNLIKGIGVKNIKSAEHLSAMFETAKIKTYPTIIVAPSIFNTNWSDNVRNGHRPIEEIYEVEDEL